MSYGALTTCPMEFSQHIPWSPLNVSHGALQHVPWSPTTCPMEPSQLSHGALHIWPVLLTIFHWDFGYPIQTLGWDGTFPLLSILPHCIMWDRMGRDGTIPSIPSPLHAHCCPVERSPSSPRNIPWNPHNMSQGACTCPMHGALQHVPCIPNNMSRGTLATCPMGPS